MQLQVQQWLHRHVPMQWTKLHVLVRMVFCRCYKRWCSIRLRRSKSDLTTITITTKRNRKFDKSSITFAAGDVHDEDGYEEPIPDMQ